MYGLRQARCEMAKISYSQAVGLVILFGCGWQSYFLAVEGAWIAGLMGILGVSLLFKGMFADFFGLTVWFGGFHRLLYFPVPAPSDKARFEKVTDCFVVAHMVAGMVSGFIGFHLATIFRLAH
jgi:hypothetical protein